MPMKYVVFYESADDVAGKAPAHFAEHVARYQTYIERGELLMIGAFADAQNEGSMGVFTTQEAAEEFVRGDPFVLNGVVKSWRIVPWNEVSPRMAALSRWSAAAERLCRPSR
jgi:uncharacterized protein YciI